MSCIIAQARSIARAASSLLNIAMGVGLGQCNDLTVAAGRSGVRDDGLSNGGGGTYGCGAIANTTHSAVMLPPCLSLESVSQLLMVSFKYVRQSS